MELNKLPGGKLHGTRHNDGKLQWSLVEMKALEPMVRTLMFGAAKYERDNWKKGLKLDEILDSLQRHYVAILNGETHDPESGLPHIGHLLCNALFYSYFTTVKPDHEI